MLEITASLQQGNQITLPPEAVAALHLHTGDRLRVTIDRLPDHIATAADTWPDDGDKLDWAVLMPEWFTPDACAAFDDLGKDLPRIQVRTRANDPTVAR